MRQLLRLFLALSFSGGLAAAAEPVAGRAVNLKASDGTKLAATYYASGSPGPGILLFHQCNRDRSTWNDLATRLAGEGFHVLTLDYRGYGESGGPRHLELPGPERVRLTTQTWPGDVDVAFAYLLSQPGVRGAAIGAGGASCGVNQSIQLARRHPEVKSLALLSGGTDRDGRKHLQGAKTLALFIAAADDDGGVVETMAWIDAASGNSANRFVEYTAGGHGTDMFKPHPELPGDIVAWFDATLLGKGAAPAPAAARARTLPTIPLLLMLDEPGGPSRVAERLAAERKKDPKAAVLAPAFVNQLGYEAIQAGDPRAAVAIMKINVEAAPTSSNAWDSLGDAFLADGQTQKALEATEKALSLVGSDASETAERKTLIRQSAEQRLAQMKSSPASK